MRTLIVTFALALTLLGAIACGSDEKSPEEGEIRAALDSFTAELNSGDFDSISTFYSKWCRSRIPPDRLAEEWEKVLGTNALLRLTDVEIEAQDGDYFHIHTEFELDRGPDTVRLGTKEDSLIEWMVKEDGQWHIHDKVCELLGPGPAPASPTAPASSTPSPSAYSP